MARPGAPHLEDNDAVTGQAFANPQSVGQMSSDPANMWHQFFGPPVGEIKTNPYDKYQYETYTLPDAYSGKNIFLRDTIEGFIQENNTWYTTVCLPTQVTDQIHLRWNAFHFDQALASVVPEEGISRLITSSRKAQEDHTIRHGLAFTLEHGFMNTDQGRRQYMLNIQQIAQCVQETNNYDVLSSILNCNDYEREWEKRHSIIRTPWNEVGRREVLEFAIVQKDPRGFEIMHEKYKKRLQRYGVSPSMWIFPPGMALYAAFNPVVSDYNKQAPNSVTLATSAEALGSFRGLNVFETREFDVRNGELPINLLKRRVQIGESYFLRNHHNNPEAFKTDESLSTVIYDERRDDWCKIDFMDAFDRVKRFGPDGDLDHNDMEGDDCPKNDPFTYRNSNTDDDDQHDWCNYFGQIETKHVDKQAFKFFCKAAAANTNVVNYLRGSAQYNAGVSPNELAPKAFEKIAGGGAGAPVLGQPDNVDPNDTAAYKLMTDGGYEPKKKELRDYKNIKQFVAAKAEIAKLRAGGSELLSIRLDSNRFNQIIRPGSKAGNRIYVLFNDSDSDVPELVGDGTTDESKANREKLRKIFGSTRRGDTDYRVNIGSAFEAPEESGVGEKRSQRAVDNQQWKSKRRAVGVQDFAETSAAEIGVAAQVVNGRVAQSAANVRLGAMETDGFVFNGKVEFYHELISELPDNERQIASNYLFSPINKEFFQVCYGNDVCPPFEILLARPHMTYDMMTCVMMKGGSETGNTFQGHSDFQLGDDVQSKIHYGNYTYYSKALVTNPKNILLARNVFAGGYVSGDDCDWIDRDSYSGHVVSGSLYAFLVPAGEHKKQNPLRLFTKPTDGFGHAFGREMTGRDFYSRVYGHDSLLSVEDFETIGTRNDTNDIVYQGHQFWWKEHREQQGAAGGRTFGSYTGVTTNTGHWGKNVYPGCGRVRNGDEVYLKDCSWDNEVY